MFFALCSKNNLLTGQPYKSEASKQKEKSQKLAKEEDQNP
jgi:hypothetical protein